MNNLFPVQQRASKLTQFSYLYFGPRSQGAWYFPARKIWKSIIRKSETEYNSSFRHNLFLTPRHVQNSQIKQYLLKGGAWALAGKVLTVLLGLIWSGSLARLLSIEEMRGYFLAFNLAGFFHFLSLWRGIHRTAFYFGIRGKTGEWACQKDNHKKLVPVVLYNCYRRFAVLCWNRTLDSGTIPPRAFAGPSYRLDISLVGIDQLSNSHSGNFQGISRYSVSGSYWRISNNLGIYYFIGLCVVDYRRGCTCRNNGIDVDCLWD